MTAIFTYEFTMPLTLSEFVRGIAKEDECEPLFKQYKSCLTVRLAASESDIDLQT